MEKYLFEYVITKRCGCWVDTIPDTGQGNPTKDWNHTGYRTQRHIAGQHKALLICKEHGNMKKTIYTPIRGSVAFKAIVFFKMQPEGVKINTRQLRSAIGVRAQNMCTYLREAVDKGVLVATNNGNTKDWELGQGEVNLPEDALTMAKETELAIERAFVNNMVRTNWAPTINPLPLPMRAHVTTQTGAQA
jgi:hypothetical protein